MPTRKIEIPPVISVRLPSSDGSFINEDFSFKSFIGTLLSQPRWGKDYRAIRTGVAIENSVADLEPGQSLVLAEEDWSLLKESAESPEQGYGLHPFLLRQLLPFFDAVVKAEAK